jgi:hypothetical protein
MAFVYMFPKGANGFNEERHAPYRRCTISGYAKARVMSKDRRFQTIEYLFYILVKMEIEKITKSINVCSNRLKSKTNNRVNNLQVYMKCLRGYSAYWNSAKADLMAMVKSLGPPTWFVTLSANDLNWPDVLKALLHAKSDQDIILDNTKKAIDVETIDLIKLNYEFKSKLLHDFPVVAARHFSRRFKVLKKFIYDDKEIFGSEIVDDWWRVEFQVRGSPHIHMLLWTKDPPPFDSQEGKTMINKCLSCSLHSPDQGKI